MSKGPPYVARAELVLARPDTDPLGELGLKPDPLQAFALALGRVRDDLGEDAEVAARQAAPLGVAFGRESMAEWAAPSSASAGGTRRAARGRGLPWPQRQRALRVPGRVLDDRAVEGREVTAAGRLLTVKEVVALAGLWPPVRTDGGAIVAGNHTLTVGWVAAWANRRERPQP